MESGKCGHIEQLTQASLAYAAPLAKGPQTPSWPRPSTAGPTRAKNPIFLVFGRLGQARGHTCSGEGWRLPELQLLALRTNMASSATAGRRWGARRPNQGGSVTRLQMLGGNKGWMAGGELA